MSIPVPLGVRVYNNFDEGPALDTWITRLVDNVTFRSVIPGGFANCTIRLHRPAPVTIYSAATATGTGTSVTPDYLVASDADAADINIGDRVHIYDSSGAIRFNGAPFTIVGKPSAFGFTNLTFSPAASASTVSGDVMRCSNATGYLQADPVVGNVLANLFNRIQIVDLRTMEICWEGRIEDPARQMDDDTWELGCLGGMVAATDVKRPVFYIDSGLDSWMPDDAFVGSAFEMTKDDVKHSIRLQFKNSIWPAATLFDPLNHNRCEQTGQYLGRFDITYDGASSFSQLAAVTGVVDTEFGIEETNIDVTTLTTASTRKGNPINAVNSFTDDRAQLIRLHAGNNHATTSVTVTDSNPAAETFRSPRVQAQRVDRNGTPLLASTDYPQEYVTVAQVVEDVVGRFLVKVQGTFNVVFAGQVRAADVYIDTSSTVQITHLEWFDGATAAEILNQLIELQPDAYWAIWETQYGATNGSGGATETGFRFEWSKWPAGWGYQATSVDGMEQQPSGEGLYNTLFYGYETNNVLYPSFPRVVAVRNSGHPALSYGEVNRATFIKREGNSISSSDANTEALSKVGNYERITNAGSIRISRPIEFYDPGSTSGAGGSRMVDPWHIRPGKLIRITDLPAPAKFNAFQHGSSAPPIEIDGTVFKIVATEYSTADNTCVLELDQVSTWATPSQIGKAAEGKPTTLRIQG